MNTPNPATPPPTLPQPGWQPSGSTLGSGAGGALAVVIVAIVNSYATHALDVVTVAAITTLCSTLAGYFFEGGRK